MKSNNNESQAEIMKHIENFTDRVREVKIEKKYILK